MSADRVGGRVQRGDRVTRYLAQSVFLEEAGTANLIRTATITISVTIVGFIVWAWLTRVDEIAITSGEVVPSGQVQTVQHLEGGIIAEIKINDGDRVEAGQILLRLDPSAVLAERDQARARYANLRLQAERLRAVASGTKPDFSTVGSAFPDLVEDQRAIYEGTLEATANRQAVLRNQIEQRKSEFEVYGEEDQTLRRNLEILQEEFLMREILFKKGLASKIVYLDVKRQLNQAWGDLEKLKSERQRTLEALAEARSRLVELESDLKENALAEMGDIRGEIAQLGESMARFDDRVRRLEIRAPVLGIVQGLKTHTIGGVIPPGGDLLEIVPLDKELIVETRISTRDVGHVEVGQLVKVKVTTYNYARYGGITGQLEDISASTFLDEQGEPFYRGIVTLDRGYVGYDPERNRVMPGMTVQADIQTGEGSLLEALIKPIYSSVSQAFRER